MSTEETELPPLPETEQLIKRWQQITQILSMIPTIQMELATIESRLHERGINPSKYKDPNYVDVDVLPTKVG